MKCNYVIVFVSRYPVFRQCHRQSDPLQRSVEAISTRLQELSVVLLSAARWLSVTTRSDQCSVDEDAVWTDCVQTSSNQQQLTIEIGKLLAMICNMTSLFQSLCCLAL